VAEARIIAFIPAKPDGFDAMRRALTALAEATRAEEGCMSYELTTSDSDPSTFVTIEHWRSQQDADHHVTTDHMAVATATAKGRVAGPLEVHTLHPVG